MIADECRLCGTAIVRKDAASRRVCNPCRAEMTAMERLKKAEAAYKAQPHKPCPLNIAAVQWRIPAGLLQPGVRGNLRAGL